MPENAASCLNRYWKCLQQRGLKTVAPELGILKILNAWLDWFSLLCLYINSQLICTLILLKPSLGPHFDIHVSLARVANTFHLSENYSWGILLGATLSAYWKHCQSYLDLLFKASVSKGALMSNSLHITFFQDKAELAEDEFPSGTE